MSRALLVYNQILFMLQRSELLFSNTDPSGILNLPRKTPELFGNVIVIIGIDIDIETRHSQSSNQRQTAQRQTAQ
jgi:hypothetical protein